MLTKNYFEERQKNFLDFSELSKEFITNENTETKLKKRKSKIFLIMSNKRKEYMAPNSQNINLNLNNTANFIRIFNLIKNKEQKSNLIYYLFTNNLVSAKHLLSEYQTALNLIIDYDFLLTSSFMLDIIEKTDEIIEIISKKKENINYLVNVMDLMSKGNRIYDYNYIMITANLMIYSKSIDKLLKKEIDHNTIIQLLIKNETDISYSYLFYIYAYLYNCDIKQIESFENVLDSLILLLKQNNIDINILLEDIYDIFVLFSNVPNFSKKFFDNYNIILGNGALNISDILIEQKLSIVINLYKKIDSQTIKTFIEKDNGKILNLILNSLKIISILQNPNNFKSLDNEKKSLNLIFLTAKILLTITYHKDLTDLFLENKEYFELIINAFSLIVSSNDIPNNSDTNYRINGIYNTFLKIVDNIIKNEHKLFISQIISNNLHLGIKDKFYSYINNNSINERHFISLINIIGSLYENQKKYKLKTQLVKLDLDNNRLNDIIIGIIKKFGENKNINDKCNIFLDKYYPNEPIKNFLQLSDFNFLDLNI
jgi:hypothetical protein